MSLGRHKFWHYFIIVKGNNAYGGEKKIRRERKRKEKITWEKKGVGGEESMMIDCGWEEKNIKFCCD